MIIIQGMILILHGNMHRCKVIRVRVFFIVTPIVGVGNCSMCVVRYFMNTLVLQSSWWVEIES